METCANCGKTFKDKRGWNGHLMLKPECAIALRNAHFAQSPANAQKLSTTTISQNVKEGKPMGEQSESKYCPECVKKHDEIHDLKAAAEKAEGAHAQALQDKTREAEGFAAQIISLKAQAEAASKPPAQEWPAVDDFVEHCKTCDTHKPQLRAFMDKVLNAMSPDEVKAQMKRLKIEESPDKIIIGIGDRELRR